MCILREHSGDLDANYGNIEFKKVDSTLVSISGRCALSTIVSLGSTIRSRSACKNYML